MPTYEYVCESCGTHVDVYQRFNEEPLTTCGLCGGKLRKVFHPAGILFKGSGFYVTDSRAKSGTRSGAKDDKQPVASGAKSEGSSSRSGSSESSKEGSSAGASSSSGSGSGSDSGSKSGSTSDSGSKEKTA